MAKPANCATTKFTLAIFQSPFHFMLHERAAFADLFRPQKHGSA